MIHFVTKGWGFEKWIVNNDKYCGKLLYFVKGKKCSLHYHKKKHETFYVQSGELLLYYSDDLVALEHHVKNNPDDKIGLYKILLKKVILRKGDSFEIPIGRVHQMVAFQDTELFEFSTMHSDDDSFRLVKGD